MVDTRLPTAVSPLVVIVRSSTVCPFDTKPLILVQLRRGILRCRARGRPHHRHRNRTSAFPFPFPQIWWCHNSHSQVTHKQTGCCVCMRSFAQKCDKIGGSLQLNTRLPGPPAFPRPDRHPSLGYSWFVVSTSRSLRPPNERARTLATHGMAGKRRPRPSEE